MQEIFIVIGDPTKVATRIDHQSALELDKLKEERVINAALEKRARKNAQRLKQRRP